MFWRAHSSESVRTNWTSAAWVAPYAAVFGTPRSPSIETTWMSRPPVPEAIISRPAARNSLTGPVRFVSTRRDHSASVRVSNGPASRASAQLTRMSRPPSSRFAARTRWPAPLLPAARVSRAPAWAGVAARAWAAGVGAPTTSARLPVGSKPWGICPGVGSVVASGLQRQDRREAPRGGAAGQPAAVQGDGLAAHVAVRVADEEHRQRPDLVGLPDPTDRDELAALLLKLALRVVLRRGLREEARG